MEKNGNLEYIKITFIHQKTPLKLVKRQAVEWEKILQYMELVPRKK